MDKLIHEVEAEKEYMSKTLKGLNKAIKRKKTTIIELAAIATFLQNAWKILSKERSNLKEYPFHLQNPGIKIY